MQNISTKSLTNLPDIDNLKRLCQSIATLDCIIGGAWGDRYYSYHKKWDKENNAECFEMYNGQGDNFWIYFSPAGAAIYGLAHESEMSSWVQDDEMIIPEIVKNLPDSFHDFIHGEPCKSNGCSFCIWREYSDTMWEIGENIPFTDNKFGDGSQDFLYILDNDPNTYKDWAVYIYEDEEDEYFASYDFDIKWAEHIYAHHTITKEVVLALRAGAIDWEDTDWDDLKENLDEIGYEYTF